MNADQHRSHLLPGSLSHLPSSPMSQSRNIPPADDASRIPHAASDASSETLPEPSRGAAPAFFPNVLPVSPLADLNSSNARGMIRSAGKMPGTTICDDQLKEAHARRAILLGALPSLERGESLAVAAEAARTSTASLCRLLKLAEPVSALGASHADKAFRLVNGPIETLAPGKPPGLVCEFREVLTVSKAADKLMEIYLSTIGASGDYMTSDRRTAKLATALCRFAEEPECPRDLAARLRTGYQPADFVRFLRKITPEIEARLRGPKHFQLHGSSSRRDMTLRLPDGTRAELPAGFLIEFDDMSINQPFWVAGPDGAPQISRQGLYARDVKSGRWLGFELIARPREAYRAEDILRFLRRLMTVYGRFDALRLEKGIWRARSIMGHRITETGAIEEEWNRPAMSDADKARLQDGLEAIGLQIHYVSSARGKGGIESGFNHLQTIVATFSVDRVNIGRHAGEFEFGAKQMRRVRSESHTPGVLGFAAMNDLAGRIEQAMGYINKTAMGRTGEAPDTTWTREIQTRALPLLAERDLAAFLPVMREVTIRGLMVASSVDGRRFDFRAPILAELGDGFRLFLKFDPSEPTLGAALYNRETSSANHHGWSEGQFIGFAAWEIPGPQLEIDATAARGLVIQSVEELYGAGAEDEGHAARKQADKFVTTSFRALSRPGQPALAASTKRDGQGRVSKIENVETMATAPAATPRKVRSHLDAPTEDQFRAKNSRRANQLAALRSLQETGVE